MNNKQTMIIKLFSTQGEEGDLKKSVLFNTKKNLLLLFFQGGWGGLRLKQLKTVSFFRAIKVRGSLIKNIITKTGKKQAKFCYFFIQKYILLKKFMIIILNFWVFFTLTFYYLKICFPQIRFQIHAYLSQSCLNEWSE